MSISSPKSRDRLGGPAGNEKLTVAAALLLLVDGNKAGALLEVHKVSFIVWLVFFGLHVLGHLTRVARPLIGPHPPALETTVPGNALRALLLATTVGTGAALTIAVLPAIDKWRP